MRWKPWNVGPLPFLHPNNDRAGELRVVARCALLLLGLLLGCAGGPAMAPESLDSGMPPCPPSDNCVSSDARDSLHAVAPFALRVPAKEAWPVVREAVAKLPRTRLVVATPTLLEAECRSAVFGFVDDLRLELRPREGTIAVRSASRLGYSDLGVNRRRVERLREELVRQGVIGPRAAAAPLSTGSQAG